MQPIDESRVPLRSRHPGGFGVAARGGGSGHGTAVAGTTAPSPGTDAMTRVYLDPSVVLLETGRGGGAASRASGPGRAPGAAADEPEPATQPGVADALNHLADEVHELVLLAEAAPPGLEHLEVEITCQPELPAHPPAGAWLITTDPEACQHVPHGIRTILVGPKRAPSHRPSPRCDMEARDLNAAVIEILASEAMA